MSISNASARRSIRFLLHSPSAMEVLAATCARLAPSPAASILLYGDVGCGKTVFARGYIQHLLRDPLVPVTSPSFLLVSEYGSTGIGRQEREIHERRIVTGSGGNQGENFGKERTEKMPIVREKEERRGEGRRRRRRRIGESLVSSEEIPIVHADLYRLRGMDRVTGEGGLPSLNIPNLSWWDPNALGGERSTWSEEEEEKEGDKERWKRRIWDEIVCENISEGIHSQYRRRGHALIEWPEQLDEEGVQVEGRLDVRINLVLKDDTHNKDIYNHNNNNNNHNNDKNHRHFMPDDGWNREEEDEEEEDPLSLSALVNAPRAVELISHDKAWVRLMNEVEGQLMKKEQL